MMCFRLDVIELAGVGAIQQRVRHGRHQRHARRPLLLDQAHHVRGVEAPHHHLLQAHHGGGLRPAPAVGVEQRDGVQFDAAVVIDEHRGHVQRVQVERAMREHHALRRARAPAGVEQLGDGHLVDRKRVGPLHAARARAGPRRLGRFRSACLDAPGRPLAGARLPGAKSFSIDQHRAARHVAESTPARAASAAR